MQKTKSIVAGVAVGLLGVGAVAVPSTPAGADPYCGALVRKPKSGYGAVSASAVFTCPGTPDGQIDYVGVVRLQKKSGSDWNTLKSTEMSGEVGVVYDISAYTFTQAPGEYRTEALFCVSVGCNTYHSASLKI